MVDRVPALLLLNRGNQVIFGNDILRQLQPLDKSVEHKSKNMEPETYSFNDMNSTYVTSDNYSFLDQTADDLSAKGSGGLRQLRNNAPWDINDNIEIQMIMNQIK